MDEGPRNPWDAPEQATSPAGDPPATTAPAPHDDDVDPNRNRVVFIAVGIFVVILVVGFLLSRGGGSDGTSNNGDGPATTQGNTSNPTPENVAITGTVDGFGRPDSKDQLGTLPNGSKWSVEKGGWGLVGGTAYVSNPDLTHRNIAWVGIGYPTGQAQVKITTMVPQAGIVFRYSGPCSYWSIESSPAVASWNIVKIDKCKAKSMGNTGVTPVEDGVTVGVRFTEKSVMIVINNKVVKTINDDSLAGSGKVGMIVAGAGAGKVRFDDFVGGGLEGQGIVKPADAKPGTGPTTTKPAGATPTTIK